MLRYKYNRSSKIRKFPFGGEKNFRNVMLQPVKFFKNEKIVDMCCGTGGLTFSIRENSSETSNIIGIDKNENRIKIAKTKNPYKNVKFIVADIMQLEFEDNFFDKIFIAHVMHEMIHEMRLLVLFEAKRILTNGGEVIILEEDKLKNPILHFFVHAWLGNYSPFSLKIEGNTRKDMFSHGIENEMTEVGFRNIKKYHKFKGSMQIVIGEK